MTVHTRLARHVAVAEGRLVHYRRAGGGAPVVLLHDAGRSSTQVARLAELAASSGVTALALDLPGHGLSEPLPSDDVTTDDLAHAVADTLDALEIGRCPLYGSGLGAAAAAGFALHFPDRVSALVLERVPLLSDVERTELLAHEPPDPTPEMDGTHLVRLWSFVRDEHVFFPWYRRERAARLGADVPGPAELHETVLDHLQAGPHYRPARRLLADWNAEQALRELRVPVRVIVAGGDGRATRFERVPDGVEVEHVPTREEASRRAVAGLFAAAAGNDPPPPARPAGRPGRVTLDVADTPFGQLLVRFRDEARGRPVVLLHNSPGSGALLQRLADGLAPHRPVFALDTLGMSDSDHPDVVRRPELEWPRLADYAGAVAAAIESLELGRVDVIGASSGSAFAVELGVLHPERVGKLVVDGANLLGVTLHSDETRLDILANYDIDFAPRLDGGHLVAAWDFVRTRSLWFPGHRMDRAHARYGPVPTAEQMQASAVLPLLKAGRWYYKIIEAIFPHPWRARLPLVQAPTLVLSRAGDGLEGVAADAARLIPDAVTGVAPLSRVDDGPFTHPLGTEAAEYLLRFLDAGTTNPLSDREEALKT